VRRFKAQHEKREAINEDAFSGPGAGELIHDMPQRGGCRRFRK
jgi:hypothetical protein